VIDPAELRRWARGLGLQVAHVEKDYVLCHVLVSVAEGVPELIFRGGTALARIYWPDYRLSEDLDFISTQRVPELETRLENAVVLAAEGTGLGLELRFGRPRGSWYRSTVAWDAHELTIDINTDEVVALDASELPIHVPYSDLAEGARIGVLSLAEILGSKWFMLNDRKEPRDLFDLWAGLIKFGVTFDEVAKGHRARYGYKLGSLHEAKHLKQLWETRLGHQMADLPSFEEAYGDVAQCFKEWSSAGNGASR
jgi:predicted nucleotidyltransferase component of viral defense system